MNYKARMDNAYLEGLFLRSDYTIGFELEGIATNPVAYQQLKIFTKNRLKASDSLFMSKSLELDQFVHDSSVKANPDDKVGVTFEMRSPIFKMAPANIQLIINFLHDALEFMYTNSSCGFHVHIKIPESSRDDIDIFWVMCHMAISMTEHEGKLVPFLQKYSKFNNVDFHNDEYASLVYLKVIKNIFDEYNPKKAQRFWMMLKNQFNSEKYKAFRLHPAGTLEWRGPRAIMEGGEPLADIKKFFMQYLFPLINTINDFMEEKEINYGSLILTRKQFNSFLLETSQLTNTSKRFTMKPENIKEITSIFPWIKKAKFKNAQFFLSRKKLVMEAGTWDDGEWIDGVMDKISWQSGIFHNGGMDSCSVLSGIFNNGKFKKTQFNGANKIKNGDFADCGFFGKTLIEDGSFLRCAFTSEFNDNLLILSGHFKKCELSGDGELKTFMNIREGLFENTHIQYAVIKGGTFINCTLIDCNISDCEISGGKIADCDIKDSTIKDTQCNESVIKNTNTVGCELIEVLFDGGDIKDGSFINSHFINGRFSKSSKWVNSIWANGEGYRKAFERGNA